MATGENVVILNNFRGRRTRSRKTGKLGKRRITMSIEAQPIALDFDPKGLGKGPAEAIQAEIESDFAKVSRQVKESTYRARQSARKALEEGKRWAMRRYGGGRIGIVPPKPANRQWGTDSGRLSENLRTRYNPSDREWTVNVPGNRLTSDRGDGMDDVSLRRFLIDLKREVPALNAEVLLSRAAFSKALEQSRDALFGKLQASIASQKSRLRSMQRRAAGGFLRLVA